jgi:hypothetical protein
MQKEVVSEGAFQPFRLSHALSGATAKKSLKDKRLSQHFFQPGAPVSFGRRKIITPLSKPFENIIETKIPTEKHADSNRYFTFPFFQTPPVWNFK